MQCISIGPSWVRPAKTTDSSFDDRSDHADVHAQSMASNMATPPIVHLAAGCFVFSCIAKTKPEPGVAVPGVARSVCL
eukprot:5618846-Prymnesium_polylepis.2